MTKKTININSKYEEIKFTRDKIRRIIFEKDIPKAVAFYLEVAVGEILANIIDHGTCQDKDETDIVLEILIYREEKVELIFKYKGNKIPIEKIESYTEINSIEKVEEIENSGRGVFLISELMDEVEYKNLSDRNRLVRIVKNI